jgi:hypothetical protein
MLGTSSASQRPHSHREVGLPRMTLVSPVLIAMLALVPAVAHAEPPHTGLLDETMLHPMDAFTGYTLKQGEFIYNQSPLTLPLPSWAWWGVTDWLTAEIDLLPLLGGFFIDPHLPVPSFNFRFRLRDGGANGPSLAFETMVQHLWNPLDQEDLEHFHVRRVGTQWFGRVNLSQRLVHRLRVHASVGVTFSEDFLVENQDRPVYRGKHLRNAVNPDASLSFDFRARAWLSLHLTGSYGTTFVYSDNQPRKWEVAYGFRLAPFYRSRFGFLRTFRLEAPAFWMYRPDAGESLFLPVPIFPYVYWQWTW